MPDDKFVIVYMPMPVGVALALLLIVDLFIWITKLHDSVMLWRHTKRVEKIVEQARIVVPEEQFQAHEALANAAIDESRKKD